MPPASSGQSESPGSRTDEDGDISGSWLVADAAEDRGMGAVEGKIVSIHKLALRSVCQLSTLSVVAPELHSH